MAQAFNIFLCMNVLKQVGTTAHDEACRLVRTCTAPHSQSLCNKFLRELIKFLSGFFRQLFQLRFRFRQRMAMNMRVEKVGSLHQLRSGDSSRQVHNAILDIAILHHQHGKRAGRFKTHEFDMFKRAFGLGCKHKASPTRKARKNLTGFCQHALDRIVHACRTHLCLNGGAFIRRQVAHFHESIDKETQTDLGWQTPGGNMRCIDEAKMLKVTHHIANGSRRKTVRQQARQVARPDRIAIIEVTVDDQPENIARPLVECIKQLMFR